MVIFRLSCGPLPPEQVPEVLFDSAVQLQERRVGYEVVDDVGATDELQRVPRAVEELLCFPVVDESDPDGGSAEVCRDRLPVEGQRPLPREEDRGIRNLAAGRPGAVYGLGICREALHDPVDQTAFQTEQGVDRRVAARVEDVERGNHGDGEATACSPLARAVDVAKGRDALELLRYAGEGRVAPLAGRTAWPMEHDNIKVGLLAAVDDLPKVSVSKSQDVCTKERNTLRNRAKEREHGRMWPEKVETSSRGTTV